MKEEKRLYEKPILDIMYLEICDIISDSINDVDGSDGDAPIIVE